ncbi:MAG: manganese-dependent inorganic pyrophosphatase [Patescibacteria group bacterium]|nr:manganese-dependent inorganic pyrophosphatase [Patescibacteria group bacterium]MBU1877223.1 manganese-dependent inorganic pyrophosphatase [Patescibacteria group bacterium]
MKEVIIIGHKNPDTDTIVSSILLAELINQTQKPIKGKAIAKASGDLNKEIQFVLNYFSQNIPQKIDSLSSQDVFLVDHGEFEQSIQGIEQANLVGVIDHHKMGGIVTSSPIFYRSEPKGSTATIIAEMFFENQIVLNKKQAGLLLAAIISDTLSLVSPTTTQEDKDMAKKLIDISGEDMDKLAEQIFEAKSDISGISGKELISRDCKNYEAGEKKFGVSVLETVLPQKAEDIQDEIFTALELVKKEDNLDFIFFALVDILKQESKIFLLEQEKVVAESAFNTKAVGRFLILPGVVSRKKQLVPSIINFLEQK